MGTQAFLNSCNERSILAKSDTQAVVDGLRAPEPKVILKQAKGRIRTHLPPPLKVTKQIASQTYPLNWRVPEGKTLLRQRLRHSFADLDHSVDGRPTAGPLGRFADYIRYRSFGCFRRFNPLHQASPLRCFAPCRLFSRRLLAQSELRCSIVVIRPTLCPKQLCLRECRKNSLVNSSSRNLELELSTVQFCFRNSCNGPYHVRS